jgi:Pentapeptide repeats (8 copies)
MTITHELLGSWSPCAEGYKRFCELFPNGSDLETALIGLAKDGHANWGYWLFNKCQEHNLFKSVTLKGYRNSGDRNSGYRNSGDLNSGSWDSGDRNSGSWDSGDRNSGGWNSGDRNSGYRNSGDLNSGSWDSGDRNSGYWNSGDRNSGDRNSGCWNSGDLNSGFFNIDRQKTIRVFGKEIGATLWEGSYKPDFLYFEITYWVNASDMTDEDKARDPYFYARDGQLRRLDYKVAFKKSWDGADKDDRKRIKDIPGFDNAMFFEISGIDVDFELGAEK